MSKIFIINKIARKYARERVKEIAQVLVISNTVSVKELTQLDIQRHTMSEICQLIEVIFGKSRLKHMHKSEVELLSQWDEGVYRGEQLVDLAKVSKQELRKVRKPLQISKNSPFAEPGEPGIQISEEIVDAVKFEESRKNNQAQTEKTLQEAEELIKKGEDLLKKLRQKKSNE